MPDNSDNLSVAAKILRATIDGTEYSGPADSVIAQLLLELKETIEEGGGGGGGQDYSTFVITATENFENNTAPVDMSREQIEAAISAGRPIAFRQNLGSPYLIPLSQQVSNGVLYFYWDWVNTGITSSGANEGSHSIYTRFMVMWNPVTEPYAVSIHNVDGVPMCVCKKATLDAGKTEIALNLGLHANDEYARIDVYTDTPGLNPSSVNVNSSGEVRVAFPAQSNDVEVMVEVRY